jgi:MerR family transcriptional regulator, copper efflux regulator
MTDNPVPPEREQPPRWQIGQLATLAATTARAIRLYEAAGLIPGPARSAAGYRLYGPADLATLIRIRRLRSLGFQLEQIRALLSPEEPADLAAALAVLREDLLRRVEALRATIEVLDGLRAEVIAGDREAYDALGPVLQAALAADADPEDTPLVVRLRERLAAVDQDPRWPALQQRLRQLRDVHGSPAGEVEQLARELAGVLPRELVPDDLADAVLPTVLLGARFSPAQLAVIHRAAQIQRATARRTDA